MTGSNKILTVSYGTFSCTLEGFDDPFGTMRGIAEYFRDLAADDRYFGAEPPTPDAEMLQNIAQREVRQRVEARVGENEIALTQVSAEAAPETAKVEDAETLDSGPLTFDDEFLMADEPEDVLTVDTDAEPVDSDEPVETVAEKLRRIRAVVSRTIEPEDPQEPFSEAPTEDAGAGSAPKKRSRALTETINSITADLADDEDATDEEIEEPEVSLMDDTPPSEVDEASEDDSVIANIVAAASSDEDDSDDNVEDEQSTADTEIPDIDPAEFDIEALEDEAYSDDDIEELEPNSASVNIEAEVEDEVEAESPAIDEAPESDLAAELEENEETPSEDDIVADSPEEHERMEPIANGESDVGRLLEETDNQFNDNDGIRRRRVISQMRAAVAATKADRVFSRIVGRELTEEKEKTPYRKDLDKAITRTPTAEESKAVEDATRKSTPLVLVSSQRVDNEDQAPTTNERKTDGGKDAPETFKDFAEQMGATELPDLLEAAAAYSAFVEGEPHFSRPEIMKRVARVDPALEMSREAGLRSFGQLLRQGKIRKLQRGQFAVSDDTRFNPGQRIAGE